MFNENYIDEWVRQGLRDSLNEMADEYIDEKVDEFERKLKIRKNQVISDLLNHIQIQQEMDPANLEYNIVVIFKNKH